MVFCTIHQVDSAKTGISTARAPLNKTTGHCESRVHIEILDLPSNKKPSLSQSGFWANPCWTFMSSVLWMACVCPSHGQMSRSQGHAEFQKKMKSFIDTELLPNIADWEEAFWAPRATQTPKAFGTQLFCWFPCEPT